MIHSRFKASLAAMLLALLSTAQADETSSVELPHVEATQLTFSATNPEHGPIGEQVILGALGTQISGLTKWPVQEKRDTTDAVAVTGGRTRLDMQRHTLFVEYVAHSRYLSGGFTGSTLSIPIPYTVERVNNVLKISLTFPDHASLERHGMPLLTRKLWDMHEILEDYASLAARTHSVELHLNYPSKGELDSKYKPEAVLGNFERKFGPPVRVLSTANQSSDSVSRDEIFACNVAGINVQLWISVYPYHDGAKVTYNAHLPFTLKPDGTTPDDDAAQTLNNQLTRIVND